MILEGASETGQTIAIPSEVSSEQPEENYLENEFKEILADGIRTLKEKEQMVISLYYMEELNMKQIAEVMNVSEPRVSQIHSGAVRKLKEYIQTAMQTGMKGE